MLCMRPMKFMLTQHILNRDSLCCSCRCENTNSSQNKMKITVTTEKGDILPLEVSGELSPADLKALLAGEVGINAEDMLLIHNMAPMTEDTKPLSAYDVQEGDIVMLTQLTGAINMSDPTPLYQPPPSPAATSDTSHHHIQSPLSPSQAPFSPASPHPHPDPQAQAQASGGGGFGQQPMDPSLPSIDWGSIQIPSTVFGAGGPSGHALQPQQQRQQQQHQLQTRPQDPNDPEVVRQHFLSNPAELAMLQQRNPPLAKALLSGDLSVFREALEAHTRAVREIERERIRMMNANPFDPEYQARIAQTIQQRNIEDNMQAALEYTPESFSRVVMLYLNIKVNGVPVKALVDSGARATVMSERCAERCNIMRLVDRRYAGIAFGVGRQKIIGRVHLGQLQIGNDFLTSSFQVLENQAEDMLLGLDMLKRHQCCIDLKYNVLRIGTTGNDAAFLSEADLKDKEQLEKEQAALGMEDEDAEMAKAIAKSEEEEEQRLQSELRREGAPPPSASQRQAPPTSYTTTISPSTLRPLTSPGSLSSTSQPRPQPIHQQQQQQQIFPESSIQEIVAEGFTREEAIEELRRCNGNATLALTALLARSIKF